jgi:hypothetical protein
MKLPILALSGFLLVGCASSWTGFLPASGQRYAARSKNAPVVLSYGEPTNRRYEKLGVVWATWYTYESAQKNMLKKAREIGADAVISVRNTTYSIGVGQSFGSFSASSNAGLTTGTGSALTISSAVGYPMVEGTAIRFVDGTAEGVQFTDPNVVDPTAKNRLRN